MKTLTEKVNGRREWSFYGLNEIQSVDDDLTLSIIISNALFECGLKCLEHRKFRLGEDLFLFVKDTGDVLIERQGEVIEKLKDPNTLFDRIRVVWENFYCSSMIAE